MKRTLKSLIAAVLCAALVTGCATDERPQSEVQSDVISGSTSDASRDSAAEGTSGTTAVTTTGESSADEQPEEITIQSESSEAAVATAEVEPVLPDDTEQPPEISSSAAEQDTPDEKPSEPPSEPAQTEATTKAQTTTTATEKKPQELREFSVDWSLNSTWEEGGKKCGGYEVTLTNNTGKSVQGWTVKVNVPSGFSITASWNGVFSVSGKTLTIKNESYNGTVEAGGKTGFGFNYSCTGDFKPSGATVNGTEAVNGTGSTDSGNNGGNNNGNEQKPAVTVETVPPAPEDPAGSNPVAIHGQLSVKGSQLVDQNGKGYQLRGMSTHGITWFPDFVNENAFRTLRDDWNTNVVRLAMYVDEWGNGQCYMKNKDGSRLLLEKGVDICIKLGMYVIIDWHVLNPGDPTAYTDEAIEFFDYISKKYADYPNVIYEIVNEPNGNANWGGVIKPYAEKVIPVIRKHDKDAVIIVGTPTWSQDIDQALADPLKEDNVMYALHFYAATHTDWLRERAEKCVTSGLPIFVSEFGCCDASGNGANDFGQSEKWLNLLDKYGISYCNWNLANKNESSSCFRESAKADGNWSSGDYSEGGAWIRKWFRNH